MMNPAHADEYDTSSMLTSHSFDYYAGIGRSRRMIDRPPTAGILPGFTDIHPTALLSLNIFTRGVAVVND